MEAKIERIRLEMIDEPKNASRESIDPDKIRELAESIRSEGLQSPIKVRPVNGRFEICFGHRRYLAHKFLGLDGIECVVQPMTDAELHKRRAVENLQREDLSPVETAKEFHRLHTECGLSIREICRTTGKALGTVQKYLNLMELDDDFKRAVDKKLIAIETAFALWRVRDDQMRSYYLRNAVENGVTVAVAELWVLDYEKSKAGIAYDDVPDGPRSIDVTPSPPVFVTCGGCFAPVEVRQVRSVMFCPSCYVKVRGGGLGKVPV